MIDPKVWIITNCPLFEKEQTIISLTDSLLADVTVQPADVIRWIFLLQNSKARFPIYPYFNHSHDMIYIAPPPPPPISCETQKTR